MRTDLGNGHLATFGLAVVAMLAAAVTGCSGQLASSSGGFGTGTGGMSGGSGSGGSGTNLCAIAIQPVAPASLDGLSAAIGTFVRLRGQITGSAVPGAGTWSWSATHADGLSIDVRRPQDDPALVDVSLPRVGSYSVVATFSDGSLTCVGTAQWVVAAPTARTAFFTFRVTPPSGALPEQETLPVAVLGGTPIGNHVISLDSGLGVLLNPVDPNGTRVPAYVRATETTSGLFQERHTTIADPSASFLLPPGRYDVLVVPDGDFAPLLLTNKRPDQLAVMSTIVVGGGTPITGHVLDSAGAPVAGAHVSLRAGPLPSTVGTTDATGAYKLLARPGSFSARVALGPTLPAWELASNAADAALGTTPATMEVRLTTLPTARIDLAMTGAGADAKVLIESVEPIADAASLALQAPPTTTTP
ncbi:MAG: carboxypeptidase-like regulatory domain-containing protein, partial [Pseudomonadota bacterium]